MLGELFFGIFYNLSVWYKLTDRTSWGMWFSIFGLVVTVLLNVLLVPKMDYMGCAVAAMTSYLLMMLASYFVGNKIYPVGYPVGKILYYFGLAAVFYAVGVRLLSLAGLPSILLDALRLLLLALYVWLFMKSQNIGFATLLAPLKRIVRK